MTEVQGLLGLIIVALIFIAVLLVIAVSRLGVIEDAIVDIHEKVTGEPDDGLDG